MMMTTEHEAVKRELGLLLETTLRLEDELNLMCNGLEERN
jgi:hypothetical protein